MKRHFLIIVFIVYISTVSGETLYVRPGHYTNIQAAINDAVNWDIIVVDPGTYYENINFLGKAITLTSLDPNDPCTVASTIIDGSLPADPNKGSVVTFSSGEGADSILSGFTITGGTGSWLQIFWQFKGHLWNRCGGGIVCYNSSSPTIVKNKIKNNLAGQGGGIYFYDHSHPIIEENIISNNHAIINHGFIDPNPADPNIYDHGDGGAIVGFQYCNAIITANIIEDNNADYYGGGIHLRQWSNGLLEDNNFISNSALLGGGIHVTYTSSPIIRGNFISANSATSLGGGGIYLYYLSDPIIERNLITENISTNGAGIAVYYSSKPTIRNNLIIGNYNGSVIRVRGQYSDPVIVNNTISHNQGRNNT
ncbi:MAG: right-handed parallel beta-helix repeat-containing protein, partial [Phycisphaerae bacterium]